MLARPEMLGHDAFILDRHQVAGELDHAAALAAVPEIERQGVGRVGDVVGVGDRVGHQALRAWSDEATATGIVASILAPSVTEPESFRGDRSMNRAAAYPFGGAASRFLDRTPAFQSACSCSRGPVA